MFILIKTDVDGHEFVQLSSYKKFCFEELLDCTSICFKEDEAVVAAQELMDNQEYYSDDTSHTQFHIKEI